MPMKFISWNVNGLRACLKKGFLDFYRQEAPDFCCLQETKMEQGQADVELNEGVLEFWNSAEKKGYSGTAVFTPHQPVAVAYGMDKDRHDHEGRLITLEYEGFYLVCCYTPNSQDGLKRLDYRMQWEDDLRDYLMSLDRTQAGGLLRGPERGPPGDRPEKPKDQPEQRRLHRPGAGKDDLPALTPALQTPSATSTRTRRGSTPGGPTASTPGRTTRGGASTISSSLTASGTRSSGRRS